MAISCPADSVASITGREVARKVLENGHRRKKGCWVMNIEIIDLDSWNKINVHHH